MKKLILLLTAAVCLGGWFAPAADALSFTIALGDQPYYSRGPGYYVGNVYYIWVPGHWRVRGNSKVWIHGHYRVR